LHEPVNRVATASVAAINGLEVKLHFLLLTSHRVTASWLSPHLFFAAMTGLPTGEFHVLR
jgi:quinol-cytochrome oxidoreductase complex cytochrome b subunit